MVEALRNPRLHGYGTTIFAEMSALAAATGAVNLGQGFPDTDGPREVAEVASSLVVLDLNNESLFDADLKSKAYTHAMKRYQKLKKQRLLKREFS